MMSLSLIDSLQNKYSSVFLFPLLSLDYLRYPGKYGFYWCYVPRQDGGGWAEKDKGQGRKDGKVPKGSETTKKIRI